MKENKKKQKEENTIEILMYPVQTEAFTIWLFTLKRC